MKIEVRPKGTISTGMDVLDHYLLISGSEDESQIMDACFGNQVDATRIIKSTVRLSDGYGTHYIELVRAD